MVKAVNDPSAIRYERKFHVEALSKEEIETIIKLHPAIFSEAFPPRVVNNIYLDTLDLKSYLDNVHGIKNRLKIRIRWYGQLFGKVDRPVLELKIKDGLVGWKKSYPLVPFTLDINFTTEIMCEVFRNSSLPPELLLELLSLQPMLLNQYQRKYLISSDQNFRITIDFNRKFYQISNNINTYSNRTNDHMTTIVELKYTSDYDCQADTISRYFPFRMTKSSKYVSGLESLNLW